MIHRWNISLATLLVLIASSSAAPVHAQAISINVGNRGFHFMGQPLQAGEIAGAYGVGNWNDLSRDGFAQTTPSAAPGTLKDSSGALVPNMAFSMTGSLVVADTYNYQAEPDAGTTANYKLMGSFLKGPFEPTIGFEVHLSAIPYAEYNLYIYVDGFGTNIMQWDIPETFQTFYSVDSSPVNFPVAGAVFSEFTATSFGAAQAELASPSGAHNVMKISGLTSPDITLIGLVPGGGEEAINGIQIVNAAGIDGDYDSNGRVDGGDFLLWQRTLGSSTELAADGNDNLLVEGGDLSFWRNRYGDPFFAMGAATAVPEPAAAGLALIAAASVGWWTRRAR